jgi:hypothetical protein
MKHAHRSLDLSDRDANHIVRVLADLARVGWSPVRFPAQGKVSRNRQLVELCTPTGCIRVRLSVYKIGDRGEAHRLDERRIEITTTFGSGLRRLRRWKDVVLGYSKLNDAYVGLDPRRLSLGGSTHNASSSVDPRALGSVTSTKILVRPYETPALGLEYQAVFRPIRLAEYLFNTDAIHSGVYRGDGAFSGRNLVRRAPTLWSLPRGACEGAHVGVLHELAPSRRRRTLNRKRLEAFENDDRLSGRDVSPDDLDAILLQCRKVGDAGEHFVYRHERRRLRQAGRNDLAMEVDWVSRKTVSKGYDIRSFEADGTLRFIEVKATVGSGATFFVSDREWMTAAKLRSCFWIYRVVEALDEPRLLTTLRDPIAAESAHKITRVADGWRVTLL